jgi:hypothetical protein
MKLVEEFLVLLPELAFSILINPTLQGLYSFDFRFVILIIAISGCFDYLSEGFMTTLE